MNPLSKPIVYLKALISSDGGSRFRQNFLKIAKANVFAQIVSFAAAPLLTRLYSPADYGTAAIFFSLLNLLLACATWRFDWSVPNAVSRMQAAALLALGLVSLIIISLISFLALWFFAKSWTFWTGFQHLNSLIFLLPIALVGEGFLQLLQAWYIREANLTCVSKTKIAQSVVGTGLNLAGGVAALGVLGLIISSVVSAWVGIGMLLRQAYGLRVSVKGLSLKTIKDVWRRFWKESTLSTIVSVINVVSQSITLLLLVQYYSPTEVGWYSLMYRLAIAPLGMVTTAIGQSFWAESAQLVQTDRKALRALYIRTTVRLIFASLPIIAICAAGPLFVGLLFGEKDWGGAGYVLPAIIPMVFGSIVFSPTNHLIVFGKQNLQLIGDIVRFLLILSALFFAKQLLLDFVVAVLLMSFASLFGHLLIFISHIKVHSRHE